MNEKIGLQDLVVLLAEKSNITPKDAEALIKECFETMEEALIEDKLLQVKNLGTFKLVRIENRESVDVSTGEKAFIPAHYEVSFSPDTELAEKVDASYASLENVEIEDETMVEEDAGDETENDGESNREEDDPYDENNGSSKRNKGYFWAFFLVASVFLLVFAGRYFGLRISFDGKKPTVRDSVAVFSDSIDNPQDSAALQTAELTEVQPAETYVNKEYEILIEDRLNTIALREYGNKAFWVYIYDENRNKISNPDLIEPGTVINIPPAKKYGIDKNNREAVEKALELEQQYKKRYC